MYLDWINDHGGISAVIHGAARGADSIAGAWARKRGVPEVACPADWKKHGKRAGPIRNAFMLDNFKPDQILAFPGGKGTEHMCTIAEAAGVRVVRAEPAYDWSKHGAPAAGEREKGEEAT